MTVLVTGGAGYIGSHMVWALVDAGVDVVVLDRLSTGFRWAVAPQARFYLGDAGDKEILRQIFSENEIESIVHFAGSIVVPESVVNPLVYYENNTSNTRTLISEAIAHGIQNFVFSSTAAVYGNQATDAPVPETAVLSPENPYGLSKLMSEIILRDAASAHDFRYVALRYFNVAGADPLGRTGLSTAGASHLLKVACEAATGKRNGVDVYGSDYPTVDGTGVRDFIHVSDLVDAHMSALGYLARGGEPLVANCGYGKGYSVLEVLRAVMDEYGQSFDVRFCPRRVGDIATMVADSTIARTVLDWTPKHDNLSVIVSTALAWERQLQKGKEDNIRLIHRRLAAASF